MKKLILFALFMSVSIFAQQSARVDSMSGNSGLGRSSIYDSSDTLIFPHLAAKYGDIFNAYYVGTNNFMGFATFNILEGLTIGMADYKSAKTLEGLTANPADHTYSLFGSYDLGGMFLGFSLDYWGDTTETENKVSTQPPNSEKTTISSYIFDVKFSLGMMLSEDSGLDALIAFGFGSYTNENYVSDRSPNKTMLNNESDGLLTFGIGGRYFRPMGQYTKFTGWGYFNYKGDGVKSVAYDGTGKKTNPTLDSVSQLLVNVGSSFEITSPNNKLKATPYLGIIYLSETETNEVLTGDSKGSKSEITNSSFGAPYIGISIEYNLRKWLTIFSGYSKVVGLNTEEEVTLGKNVGATVVNTTDTATNGFAVSGFSIGFSMHNEDMALITKLSNDFLNNGPNFVSGETTNNMFASLTFEYKFGNDFRSQGKEEVKKEVIQEMKKETKKEEVKSEEKKTETKTTDDGLF